MITRWSSWRQTLRPSPRGELEITDLNRLYLEHGPAARAPFGRGVAWLDTGTPDSLLQAANFIQVIEERQGLKIGCPEEVAFRQGWITAEQLLQSAALFKGNLYGQYLERLAREESAGSLRSGFPEAIA